MFKPNDRADTDSEDNAGIYRKTRDVDQKTKTREHIEKISRLNKGYQIRNGLIEKTKLEKRFTSEQPLLVVPDEVIFKDIIPGQIYQMYVQVRNLTKYVKRVRVFQPKTSNFRCDYDMMGAIAPGLSIELIISFESAANGEFRDSVKIASEDEVELEIPIYAFSPTAKIVFEPFINMGFVQVGKEKREMVKFRNEGSVDKRVDLKINEATDLKIFPTSSFILKASEEVQIELVYTPSEAGIFRGLIEVLSEGQCFLRQIDVNATCVEF
jgi:hypothetical protein